MSLRIGTKEVQTYIEMVTYIFHILGESYLNTPRILPHPQTPLDDSHTSLHSYHLQWILEREDARDLQLKFSLGLDGQNLY